MTLMTQMTLLQSIQTKIVMITLTKTVDNRQEITQDQEKLIPQNDNVITKNDNDIEIKSNGYSQKVSYPSYVSYNNPLISESDLSIGGQYDPEIINNIHRVHPNSDRWFCYNCLKMMRMGNDTASL